MTGLKGTSWLNRRLSLFPRQTVHVCRGVSSYLSNNSRHSCLLKADPAMLSSLILDSFSGACLPCDKNKTLRLRRVLERLKSRQSRIPFTGFHLDPPEG
jgi:hypothetical protein